MSLFASQPYLVIVFSALVAFCSALAFVSLTDHEQAETRDPR